MLITYPSYYKHFTCIASNCPDSCCHEWTVDVDEKTAALSQKLSTSISKTLSEKKSSLSEKTARIAALSPLSVMARGYSIISTDDGHAVTSVENLQTGETLDLRFCDGSAKAQITQITKGDKN